MTGRFSVAQEIGHEADTPRRRSIETVAHWRSLREALEPRVHRLEAKLDGYHWDSATSKGRDALASERRYELLLRFRQLHAKLRTRERLAVEALAAHSEPHELRRE